MIEKADPAIQKALAELKNIADVTKLSEKEFKEEQSLHKTAMLDYEDTRAAHFWPGGPFKLPGSLVCVFASNYFRFNTTQYLAF